MLVSAWQRLASPGNKTVRWRFEFKYLLGKALGIKLYGEVKDTGLGSEKKPQPVPQGCCWGAGMALAQRDQVPERDSAQDSSFPPCRVRSASVLRRGSEGHTQQLPQGSDLWSVHTVEYCPGIKKTEVSLTGEKANLQITHVGGMFTVTFGILCSGGGIF